MSGAATKSTIDGITDKGQNFLECAPVLPACDNMNMSEQTVKQLSVSCQEDNTQAGNKKDTDTKMYN